MASPFDVFRKNQKVLMVAITVLAMISFVFFDSVGNPPTGRQEDPVAVESRYFKLHDSQLAKAIVDRQIVHTFVVESVAQALMQQQMRELQAQQIPQEMLSRFLDVERITGQANAYAEGRFGPSTEESVVESLALAEEAKRLGMVASDAQVFSFMAQITAGMLGGEQLNQIIQNMNAPSGGKLTLRQITEAFRSDMLAVTMRETFADRPAGIMTPTDRWEAYMRKNCRATAEVLPINTADLIKDKKVRTPSESELTAFYDEYRYQEPVPGSPDPGFKSPQKARFQYLAADEGKFLAPDKITNEEIAAHYEENKARYPYEPENFSEPEKKDERPKEPTKVTPECGDDEEESSCDQAEETKPAATASATPAATATATVAPKATAAPTVSATAAPTATATATPSAAPSATPTASVPSISVPTATSTGTAAPIAKTVLPPGPLPTENLLLPDDVRTGRNPQYEPLWKVEGKIRDELARKAATEAVRKLFDEIKPQLLDEALQRDTSKPDALIYDEKQWEEKFAKYPNLTAKTTPVMTDAEVRLAAEGPGLFKSDGFARTAFADAGVYVAKESIEIPEFSLLSPENQSTIRYLWWKITYEPAKVPELKDIKDQVIFAWQTREARAEARKMAADLAKQAQQSPKSLAEQFPDRDVKLTNAFSWFEVDLAGQFDGQPRPTRISRVDGVVDAGNEFMQAAFELEVDQVGAAMNEPQTICYVIRQTSLSPPRPQLYDSFMTDHFQLYQSFSRDDAVLVRDAALKAMLAQADIKWLREPRERSR